MKEGGKMGCDTEWRIVQYGGNREPHVDMSVGNANKTIELAIECSD